MVLSVIYTRVSKYVVYVPLVRISRCVVCWPSMWFYFAQCVNLVRIQVSLFLLLMLRYDGVLFPVFIYQGVLCVTCVCVYIYIYQVMLFVSCVHV